MPRSACEARMSDHSSDDGRCSGPPDSLTAAGEQDSSSPNEREGAGGGLPGLPRTEEDDCKSTYSGQPLSRIATETAGTRGEPDD